MAIILCLKFHSAAIKLYNSQKKCFPTSVLVQDPYLYCTPGGGSSNCPTTVESSATSLAWIKNPQNFGAAAVDSRIIARDNRICRVRYNTIACIVFTLSHNFRDNWEIGESIFNRGIA